AIVVPPSPSIFLTHVGCVAVNRLFRHTPTTPTTKCLALPSLPRIRLSLEIYRDHLRSSRIFLAERWALDSCTATSSGTPRASFRSVPTTMPCDRVPNPLVQLVTVV